MAKFTIEITEEAKEKGEWYSSLVGQKFECNKETKEFYFPDPTKSPLVPPADYYKVEAMTVFKKHAIKLK